MNNDRPYEAPTIQPMGSVADLTEASSYMNGDVAGGHWNAFS
jgi:hypothetical protein